MIWRRAVVVAALAASVGAFTACGDDPPSGTSSSTESTTSSSETSTSSTTSTTVAECVVDDGQAADLEPLVTDHVPAGYEAAAEDAEDTGPTDLDRAAYDVGDPDEGVTLRGLGFRRGYTRYWYAEDANDLVLYLYEFCEPGGAAHYVDHGRDRLLSPLWGAEEVPVDGLDGATALLERSEGRDQSFVIVLTAKDGFFVAAGTYGILEDEPVSALTGRAAALVAAQIAEL